MRKKQNGAVVCGGVVPEGKKNEALRLLLAFVAAVVAAFVASRYHNVIVGS